MADYTYEGRLRRYQEMQALRDAGKSYRDIASAYNVSRERVRQILSAPPQPVGRPPK